MATGSPTSSPGSGSATPKSTSSSPTPAASPKTGPTASSPQHSPTRSIRARTTETAFTPTGAGTPSRIAANRNIRPLHAWPRAESELARGGLGRVRGRQRHARGHDAAYARLRVHALAARNDRAARPRCRGGEDEARSRRPPARRDVGLRPLPRRRSQRPAGNRILLHHRYAPYPDGSTP